MTIDEAHKCFPRAEEVTTRDLRRVVPSVQQHTVAGHFLRYMAQTRQMDAFWHRSFWLQEQGYAPSLDFV
jgi:hypothetical protein